MSAVKSPLGISLIRPDAVMSHTRPPYVSLHTRGSRPDGLPSKAMTSVFLSPPAAAPPFFSPPPHPAKRDVRTMARRARVFMTTPSVTNASKRRACYHPASMRLTPIIFFVALVFPLFARADQQKVIVLGFDGVDARYTERWMNEGKLPNLAKLRAQGTFRPLRPTLPAQTPVSWSTFSTGIDPGRTGIFDFLRRDPKNYLPVFAAFDETKEPFAFGEKNPAVFGGAAFAIIAIIALLLLLRWRTAGVVMLIVAVIAGGGVFVATQKLIPVTRPGVVNRRQGIPFWEAAANA